MQGSEHPVFRVSVIAIVLFQVAALFCRSMLDLSLRRRGIDAAVANDLSYLVVPPIMLALMFPYLQRCRDSLRSLFSPRLLTPRVVVISIVLGLTLRLTYWASLTFLIGIGVIHNHDPNAIVGPIVGFDCPPLPVLVLSFAVMAGLAPIVEEIIHRGFILFGTLAFGTNVAILGSAAYFALLHETGTCVAAFIVGLVLAIQTLNYRALWGPIIAHATYNGVAVVDWDCMMLIWNPTTTDPTLIKLKWMSVPIIIAGSILALILTSKKLAGARLRVPQPNQLAR